MSEEKKFTGSRQFKADLSLFGAIINLGIGAVAVFGYLFAHRVDSSTLRNAALTSLVCAPFVTLCVSLIHGFFNKRLYLALDNIANGQDVSEDLLRDARKTMLLIPWRAALDSVVIWGVIVPWILFFAQPSQSLGAHISPVTLLCIGIAFALPTAVVVLQAFELRLRKYLKLCGRAHKDAVLPFALTLEKRLVSTLLTMGPYCLGLVCALVYIECGHSPVLFNVFVIQTIGCIISLGIMLQLSFYIHKTIVVPMNQLTQGLEAIHSGNLDYRLPFFSLDEWSIVAERFETMAEGLTEKERLGKRNVELLRLYEEASHKANTDPLTGLNNRRSVESYLERSFEDARNYNLPFCVIMLDIDHFKSVNDTYGHAAGDMVISMVAASVRENCRLSDIASRWGGEEFLISLPHTESKEASTVAERIRASVEQLEFSADSGLMDRRVTASLGIAQLVLTDSSWTDLSARADAALYEAKNTGRNRCVLGDAGC